jgi:hypothetical protein
LVVVIAAGGIGPLGGLGTEAAVVAGAEAGCSASAVQTSAVMLEHSVARPYMFDNWQAAYAQDPYNELSVSDWAVAASCCNWYTWLPNVAQGASDVLVRDEEIAWRHWKKSCTHDVAALQLNPRLMLLLLQEHEHSWVSHWWTRLQLEKFAIENTSPVGSWPQALGDAESVLKHEHENADPAGTGVEPDEPEGEVEPDDPEEEVEEPDDPEPDDPEPEDPE